MEPEGSLPCSQEPATFPCPEPNESNPHPLCRVHDIFRLRLIFTYAAFWTCVSSLSLTPTLSYLLPCLGFLFGTQDHYCAGLRPGNFWKFCFGPGRSTRSLWSADVTSTRYRKFVFAYVFCGGLYPLGTWQPRRILLGGFSVFVYPWQLQGITFLCFTLYGFVLSCVLLNHSFHYTLL
jgi:hypothetical protein